MHPRYLIHIACCLLLLLPGCIEPYAPDVMEGPNRYLVVDGLINGNGVTMVKLSRTQHISEESIPILETQATLLLEEEQGAQHTLHETAPGTYASSPLQLDPGRNYRLFIRLATGQEYVSDFVPMKQTPPIDEVGWQALDNELQIYVNSRDPQNDTHYYRWEYEATWAFTAAFQSSLKYDAAEGRIVPRSRNDENIYRCWKTENSTGIKLGTTARLSQDVIHEYPILTLLAGSEELRIRFSILVKQYALTQEAYQYWEALRKNTESIGTLFDPLPSQLTGNVHNLANPEEPVIGYVGASAVQEKRMFVSEEELPEDWRTFYPTCPIDSLLPEPPQTLQDIVGRFSGDTYLPVSEIYAPMGSPAPIGYMGASIQCVDCRVYGTNVQPAFWE